MGFLQKIPMLYIFDNARFQSSCLVLRPSDVDEMSKMASSAELKFWHYSKMSLLLVLPFLMQLFYLGGLRHFNLHGLKLCTYLPSDANTE
jgi:hypothetical protein